MKRVAWILCLLAGPLLADTVRLKDGTVLEGAITAAEFEDIKVVKVGDTFDVLIEKLEDKEGMVILSKEKAEFKQNWEKLKLKEGKKSVLAGVPKSLPSIVKAMRLQEKSKQVCFEWENSRQVWEKVREEINELEIVNSAKAQTKQFSQYVCL